MLTKISLVLTQLVFFWKKVRHGNKIITQMYGAIQLMTGVKHHIPYLLKTKKKKLLVILAIVNDKL